MHDEASAAPLRAKAIGSSPSCERKTPQFKARDADISHEEHPEESQEKAFKPVDVSADS
jgi:hypothetical protein